MDPNLTPRLVASVEAMDATSDASEISVSVKETIDSRDSMCLRLSEFREVMVDWNDWFMRLSVGFADLHDLALCGRTTIKEEQIPALAADSYRALADAMVPGYRATEVRRAKVPVVSFFLPMDLPSHLVLRLSVHS